MHHFTRREAESASPLLPALKSEEPSLSELNPLFTAVELHIPSSVEPFKSVTLGLIDQYGGLRPDVIKSMIVPSHDPKEPPAYRFVVRFEVGSLTRNKIHYLVTESPR